MSLEREQSRARAETRRAVRGTDAACRRRVQGRRVKAWTGAISSARLRLWHEAT